MSAAVLREAAALMRERAEFAQPGPWVQNGFEYDDVADSFTYDIGVSDGSLTSLGYMNSKDDATHIASWHPAVALVVADALDRSAAVIEEAASGPLAMAMTAIAEPLIDVARTYLGAVR